MGMISETYQMLHQVDGWAVVFVFLPVELYQVMRFAQLFYGWIGITFRHTGAQLGCHKQLPGFSLLLAGPGRRSTFSIVNDSLPVLWSVSRIF